jgi:DNA-binding response OmpR family regulator
MARLFVVEDDRAMLRGIEENLRYEGHVVRSAQQGDLALREIATDRPDLVILDVMLPGLSGFEVCRQVRRTDRRLPILMLTARADDVDKVMGLDLGADDYLTKPFSLSELLARVRALLRRSERQAAAALPDRAEFGGATIDFARYSATRDGAAIHLTAKEFALLRQLVAADGTAIRRETLLEDVWGEGVNVTNRTVDTHIRSLRQKLERDSEAPQHLLTVHGVGYRFVRQPS